MSVSASAPTNRRPLPPLLAALAILVVVEIVMLTVPTFVKEPLGASSASAAVMVKIAIAAAITIVGARLFGLLRPALREERSWPRWTLAIPVALLVSAFAVIAGVRYDRDSTYLIAMLGITLIVAISEELLYRGVLVVGLRSVCPEWAVWLLSTAVFAVVHFGNLLEGVAPGDVIGQVVGAFGLGTAMYLARRGSGTIILPIILHMLLDLGILAATEETARSTLVTIGGTGEQVVYLISIVLVVILTILESRRATRKSAFHAQQAAA